MSEMDNAAQLARFLEQWPAGQAGLKKAYLQLLDWAGGLPGAVLGFVARPGVSNSLRCDLEPRPAGRERPVFFLVDAVDDGGERFLSVCGYADEISDPEERGNTIPLGLYQEDGYCFDLEDDDPDFMAYLNQRLREAHASALKG